MKPTEPRCFTDNVAFAVLVLTVLHIAFVATAQADIFWWVFW